MGLWLSMVHSNPFNSNSSNHSKHFERLKRLGRFEPRPLAGSPLDQYTLSISTAESAFNLI
jgi:hypothetical protein